MAFEEAAFTLLPRSESYVLLWQNDNTIVVGRNQNTAAEINAEYFRAQNINVVRRLTGGGAVYHDLGNLNFTFVMDAPGTSIDFSFFTRPVLDALHALGVNAELSGRNDLLIDGRKFSGNAQLNRQGRVLHHGTLMFDSRLDVLREALKPSDAKLAGKAVSSVKSRVTNIREHTAATMEEFKQTLLSSLFPGGVEAYTLSGAEQNEIQRLRDTKYATWDWNYGQSPPYTQSKTRRFPMGEAELRLDIQDGRIHAAKLYGDFFAQKELTELETRLIGHRPLAEDLTPLLMDIGSFISGMTTDDFLALL